MKHILFLDSNDGIQNYDNSASEYNNYHSYNLYFPLSIPLLNVKSISLKSIELPINLQNVRKFTGNSELSFSFIKDGATTSFTYWVNSGYYTTMNDLFRLLEVDLHQLILLLVVHDLILYYQQQLIV
jgi:hypothetical protein